MEVLRALLYSAIIFVGLAILAVLVAGIMMIIYSIVHRGSKKTPGAKAAVTGMTGKVG